MTDGRSTSLLAVQLVAQVQQKLGIDDEHNYLLVTDLLNEPAMRAFISTVEDIQRAGHVPRVTHAGPEPNWRDPRQVFLTGATGFLGAHLTRVESIHLFGFPIRKPTNLVLAYASVPGRATGWLIQAKRAVDSATPDWQR